MTSKSIDNNNFLSLSSIAGSESMNQYQMQDFDTDNDNDFDDDNNDIIDLEEQEALSLRSKLKLKLKEDEKPPATTNSSSEKIYHYSFMGPTTDDGDEEPITNTIKVNNSKRSSNSNSNSNSNNNSNNKRKDGVVFSKGSLKKSSLGADPIGTMATSTTTIESNNESNSNSNRNNGPVPKINPYLIDPRVSSQKGTHLSHQIANTTTTTTTITVPAMSNSSSSNSNSNNNNGGYKDGGIMSSTTNTSPTKNILAAPKLITQNDQSLSTKKMQGTLSTYNINNHNYKNGDGDSDSDSTPVNHPTEYKNKDSNNNRTGQQPQQEQQRMTRKELSIAAIIFGIVVIAVVTATFVAMAISKEPKVIISGGGLHNNNNNNNNNNNKKSGNGNNSGDTALTSTMTSPPSLPSEMKLSIEEEWMLVYSALQENEITRELLLVISDDVGIDIDIDDDDNDYYNYKYDENGFELSNEVSFYEELISGLVFSETERDWIPATVVQVEDNTMMSMSKSGDSGSSNEGRIIDLINDDDDDDSVVNINNWNLPRSNDKNNDNKMMTTTTTVMTPNQKATAWLLFHDEIKDPNESVWRWAMASIYYKMNGQSWKNMNFENWFNSNISLCKWERLNSGSNNYNNNCGGGNGSGSSGDNKLQLHLPTEIDFDGLNIIGEIPIEFALLGGTTSAALSSTSSSSLRSIMLTDNKLYGTIPGRVFEQLRPSLGKLYLDHNQFTGTVPLELGGMDTLYVQNNLLTGDWPEPFCYDGDETVNNFGVDCDTVECLCCASMNCYYLK